MKADVPPDLVPVLDWREQPPIDVRFWRLLCTLSGFQLVENTRCTFGGRFAIQHMEPQEIDVILYALVAAVLLLVAVAFISSIDFSNTRRH